MTTWTVQTARTSGAVALIQIDGDVDHALRTLGIAPVRTGDMRLRDLAGVDTGIVARWTDTCAHLMPHGGPEIMRRLVEALRRAGLPERESGTWPEATDDVEAHMLDALSRSPSPLAIDLLLRQPERWRHGFEHEPDDILDDVRMRLLDPPLVVAIGGANIGKSTLANELAGRTVAIVADEPGTTRDHVGIDIDMAGLIVRYVDTPGILDTPSAIDRQAASIVDHLVARATLVLRCADATSVPPEVDTPSFSVALRTDLGPPAMPCDAHVCAARAEGLDRLATRIRDLLVPPSALESDNPWRFWPD